MVVKESNSKKINSDKLLKHYTCWNRNLRHRSISRMQKLISTNYTKSIINPIPFHTETLLEITSKLLLPYKQGGIRDRKYITLPREGLPDHFDSISDKARIKIYLFQHLSSYYRWIYTRSIDENHVWHVLDMTKLLSHHYQILTKDGGDCKTAGRKLFDTTKSGIQFLPPYV